MTTTLHAIYRLDMALGRPGWSSYSMPHAVYVAADTLDEARSEFLAAARWALDDLDGITVVEHIEKPSPVPGLWIRTALDQRVLQRDAVVDAIESALRSPKDRDEIACGPQAATGDVVIIACTPADTLGWVSAQVGHTDEVYVAARVSDIAVWTQLIAGNRTATAGEDRSESLAPLIEQGFTVSDLMQQQVPTVSRRLIAR